MALPGKPKLDAYISAHSVYDYSETSKIVPHAAYVTLLRRPVNHLPSAWKYWDVEVHAMRNSKKISLARQSNTYHIVPLCFSKWRKIWI